MTHDYASSTMMSLLYGVVGEDEQQRVQQLERFANQYAEPLVKFLIHAKGVPALEAEETVQDFWLKRLIAPNPGRHFVANFLSSNGNRAKGAFRAYLGTSIYRHYIDRVRLNKRSPSSLDAMEGYEVPTEHEFRSFDAAWANAILRRCVDDVYAECVAKKQQPMWVAFCLHILRPKLLGVPSPGYAALAEQLDLKNKKQTGTLIRTVLRKFQARFHELTADYLPTSDDELRDQRIREECTEVLNLLAQPDILDVSMFQDVLVTEIPTTGLPLPTPTSIPPLKMSAVKESAVKESATSAAFDLSNSVVFLSAPMQGLYTSIADFAARWEELLQSDVREWLINYGEEASETESIKLSEIIGGKRASLDLLALMRNTAKRLALESPDESTLESVLDPQELLATIYMVAIASAYLQHRTMLTSDLPPAVLRRVDQIRTFPWLDSGGRQLFERFRQELMEE